MNFTSYHDLIQEELDKRKSLNNSYSMRAFARDLGISAATLSQVLKRKNGLSLESAELIAFRLGLNEVQKEWFFSSVGALHSRSQRQKLDFQKKFDRYKTEAKIYTEIHLEYFKVISDWYHFAILELTHTEGFQSDIEWIANTLSISEQEAETAIQRLLNLELLKMENGKYVDIFVSLATPNDVPSMSLKKFHHQLMNKALDALYKRDILEREISSTVFALNKEDLPRIKEKIRKFRRELEQECQQSPNKNSVYCLGIQFHELTRRIE